MTRMLRLLQILLLVPVLMPCQLDKLARVNIEVLAELTEEPVPGARVELFDRGTLRTFDAKGSQQIQVPFGQYTLRVSRPGFKSHEQLVIVSQSDVFIRVELNVSMIADTVPLRVSGRVIPARTGMWVKLVPILEKELVPGSRIAADGRFQISGMRSGRYLMIVVDGVHVVATRELLLGHDENIEIRLPKE